MVWCTLRGSNCAVVILGTLLKRGLIFKETSCSPCSNLFLQSVDSTLKVFVVQGSYKIVPLCKNAKKTTTTKKKKKKKKKNMELYQNTFPTRHPSDTIPPLRTFRLAHGCETAMPDMFSLNIFYCLNNLQ